jgi:hypothetical protein
MLALGGVVFALGLVSIIPGLVAAPLSGPLVFFGARRLSRDYLELKKLGVRELRLLESRCRLKIKRLNHHL